MSEKHQAKQHWETVYATKATDAVSWFQPQAATSLKLIQATGAAPTDPVIDVGGGASTLVDGLLANGFANVSVLDLSGAALAASRARLGEQAATVQWLEADITQVALPAQRYAVWHDRAVFHFLVDEADRAAYRKRLLNALQSNGQVIIATFAENGPTQCSGLPIRRYRAEELHAELGESFELVDSYTEEHRTPSGAIQQFVYVHLRRVA
ncbi:MAG: methyltransferase domain-containing protein [Gallionella sp.]|nr:methyltransferase domain-containing protein [Gallionella sp.]MDD4959739.1 methyltransferase domain-containing protein [Gallionella sp.]